MSMQYSQSKVVSIHSPWLKSNKSYKLRSQRLMLTVKMNMALMKKIINWMKWLLLLEITIRLMDYLKVSLKMHGIQ
jgi:hypothetical protein